VLLKNVNGALPLKAPKVIAIFGNDAGEPTQGFLDLNYEYGTLVTGGGSGTGHLSSIITPLHAIRKRAAHDGAKIVQYWLNNTLVANSDIEQLLTPQTPDVCLVLLKTWAEEAADRNQLSVDWDGDAVVESVASTCTNTIIVTHSAGINTLPWSDHPNVTAILAAHYLGEQAGYSLTDILYGDVNPSGHLPYTIACRGSDYNALLTTAINTTGFYDWQSWFDERLEIDYCYFDAHNIPVRYEFGFGLSYTTFDILDLRATRLHRNISSHPEHLLVQPGGNPALWESMYNVTISLTNSGDLAGASVPQLYVGFPLGTPAGTPPRQLRGFEKVYLEAGETQTVGFELMRRDLSYWDVVSQQWVILEGEFAVYLGFSSRDLIAQQQITVVSA
jgi:beta-glucosidase